MFGFKKRNTLDRIMEDVLPGIEKVSTDQTGREFEAEYEKGINLSMVQ